MEHLDFTDFSELQKAIMSMRIDGKSFSFIINHYNTTLATKGEKLSREALSTCIYRSALALKWEKGMKGGNDKYLSGPDFKKLKEIVIEKAHDDEHLDAADVLNEALSLKKARIKEGIQFLHSTGSFELASQLEQTPVEAPVRSWVNKRCKELEASLRYKRLIDPKRLIACTPDNIKSYHSAHSELISSTPPVLTFGADETMLEPGGKRKIVAPDVVDEILGANIPDAQHITAMCAHNIIGVALPPMIILKDLKRFPVELKPFIQRGQIWLASSMSGWQTRDTFIFWVICFINWLSDYRLHIDPSYKEKAALLIMDGHTSRECPIGMLMMRANNINVLIIPSHTSHVLQMFDVSLASPLKLEFGKKFRALLHGIDKELPLAPQVRQCAVSALVHAWSKVCNQDNTEAGARATGTFPCQVEIVLANRFVNALAPEIAQRYPRRAEDPTSINGKVITDFAMIETINTLVAKDERWSHLCLRDSYPSYVNLAAQFINEEHNNCRFFGFAPPYVLLENVPVLFPCKY